MTLVILVLERLLRDVLNNPEPETSVYPRRYSEYPV